MVRLSFAVLLVLALTGHAQTGTSEVQLRLDLKRAQLNERVAAEAAKRTEELFERGLASEVDLRATQTDLQRAAVDTEKAQVALLNELPSFRVLSAEKSVREGGDIWVDLRLEELDRLRDERVRRSFLVSLKGATSIISEPYQRQVTLEGRGSGIVVLPFRLLKDADEVSVLVVSGTRREEIPILLQRSRTANLVVACPNFSQQGALGEAVDYALQIDRFARGLQTVRLDVQGLPAGFTSELIDGTTRAKLTLARFASDQNAIAVIVRVLVPAQAGPDVLGRPLRFHVSVQPEEGTAILGGIDLQLRPVGWPRLALVSDNLLLDLRTGTRTAVQLSLQNVGDAEARDITFDFQPPIGFRAELLPQTIPVLRPAEKRTVTLNLRGEEDAVSGEYTLKVRARARDVSAQVESTEQSFRIVLARPAAMYWLALPGGALAIAGFGFARRRRKRVTA